MSRKITLKDFYNGRIVYRVLMYVAGDQVKADITAYKLLSRVLPRAYVRKRKIGLYSVLDNTKPENTAVDMDGVVLYRGADSTHYSFNEATGKWKSRGSMLVGREPDQKLDFWHISSLGFSRQFRDYQNRRQEACFDYDDSWSPVFATFSKKEAMRVADQMRRREGFYNFVAHDLIHEYAMERRLLDMEDSFYDDEEVYNPNGPTLDEEQEAKQEDGSDLLERMLDKLRYAGEPLLKTFLGINEFDAHNDDHLTKLMAFDPVDASEKMFGARSNKECQESMLMLTTAKSHLMAHVMEQRGDSNSKLGFDGTLALLLSQTGGMAVVYDKEEKFDDREGKPGSERCVILFHEETSSLWSLESYTWKNEDGSTSRSVNRIDVAVQADFESTEDYNAAMPILGGYSGEWILTEEQRDSVRLHGTGMWPATISASFDVREGAVRKLAQLRTIKRNLRKDWKPLRAPMRSLNTFWDYLTSDHDPRRQYDAAHEAADRRYAAFPEIIRSRLNILPTRFNFKPNTVTEET